ncbi:unnamed protein product [Adineta steineri]|uniref:G-protein coupled receptors family 1 profile domain-containing protein n=1 Tax=Adineta steineri TaxID=433720 RepID=A0A819AMT4_9BILA|nr:unnamed protein product [Adineta steineri]CAF3782417.1 unnamed protein product [Adineta steineri]CAF3814452.1 unnamed protein product [Adineta steineri]
MSSSVATTILFVSKEFALYGYFIILISGIIGNIGNILVFTYYKIFRRNQCAFYLIVETITDCCLLLVALPFRISELAFALDLTRASLIWCKLKAMISYTSTLITFSAICFAAIDQYLSTNYHPWLRQLSTLKLAHRLTYSSIIIWVVYGSMFLIFFEIQSTAGCTIYNVDFARYFSFFHYIMLNGMIPILVSSIFSLLAYLNVRRIVQMRMIVVRRKLDKQLTAMVLTKVVFLVCTILPSIIFRIYILNVTVDPNDTVRIAIHQLVSNIAYALFYINPACTFYLFLLVSPRFRRQVKYTYTLIKNFSRRYCRTQRQNQIAPNFEERSDLDQ